VTSRDEIAPARSFLPVGYRWTIVALLFSATTINYMDRQILGILAPKLQHDIGWTEQQYGDIVTAFQVAYAIGLGTMGRFIDVGGTKRGYSIAIAIWSLAAMGHALVRSVFGFAVARFALGIGEAGNFPAAVKTVAEWFPRRERAFATGVFNTGSTAGAVLAPLIVPTIALHWGWQAAFVLLGALGFIWIVFWIAFYDTPAVSKRVHAAELAHIHSDPGEASAERISWLRLLSVRQTWAYIAAVTIASPVWWFFLYWLPKFLSKNHGLDLGNLGLPLAVIYFGASFGSIGGGGISSILIRRGWTLNAARKTGLFLTACCALPVVFAANVPSLGLAITLITLAAAANQGYYANLYTTASDLFPKRAVASVVGLGGMFGSAFAAVFAQVAGYVLQQGWNYTGLFIFSGSAYLISLLAFHLLAPRMEPAVFD
jgi:ACS family hexuronate transporter-like MFS transporter